MYLRRHPLAMPCAILALALLTGCENPGGPVESSSERTRWGALVDTPYGRVPNNAARR